MLVIVRLNVLARSSESRSVMSDSLPSHGLYSPWNSAGQNTGVGSLSLLQGIFPTQGSTPGLPHQSLYQLSHKRSPLPISRGSSNQRMKSLKEEFPNLD